MLLVLMGLALIFRTPLVMDRIAQIEYYAHIKWLVRIILYVIAVMLIVGGSRKVYDNYKSISISDGN